MFTRCINVYFVFFKASMLETFDRFVCVLIMSCNKSALLFMKIICDAFYCSKMREKMYWLVTKFGIKVFVFFPSPTKKRQIRI